jgi:hypothetical protein
LTGDSMQNEIFDAINVGCVPTKTLVASARVIH